MAAVAGSGTDIDHPNDHLVEDFLACDIPEILRGELVDGEILITPFGGGIRTIARLVSQIIRGSAAEWDFLGRAGLIAPSAPGRPRNHVIPDGVFVRCDADLPDGENPWNPIEDVAATMLVEFTRARPEQAREAKRYSYARAAVPFYLLVDQHRRKTILFSGPRGGDYRRADWAPFGKPLPLPEPFGIDLDTSDFA
ncbi:hypothetical protein BJF79_35785 [Actinomadura sp. CNU-125]|uniref:Uma2 family endonuclease n=1 Tax=Actinomadura sp. CNU-125 TaxID=1904961 RepID=UPI00095C4337|nr:Uma2 family endonuclease [Actinomadura sp. CNU-125]OLT32652.1 hypothetical protein BJF79_35785 [Actinomadura sp. CNU-125]